MKFSLHRIRVLARKNTSSRKNFPPARRRRNFISTKGERTSRDSGIKSENSVQFSRSVVSDSVIPFTAARQASLSITNSRSLLKLVSIELMMPSIHLILCCPLLLPPSIFPSISSVQFSRSVVSDSLQPHEPQHARLPCLSPTLLASGSFQMSQLFALGGQSIGVSASASVLPMTIQD